jgi:hypothetical protein
MRGSFDGLKSTLPIGVDTKQRGAVDAPGRDVSATLFQGVRKVDLGPVDITVRPREDFDGTRRA